MPFCAGSLGPTRFQTKAPECFFSHTPQQRSTIRTSCRPVASALSTGLRALADEHRPSRWNSNAGVEAASMVAGMVAGPETIGDTAQLRQYGMGRLFARGYAPSPGSFLSGFALCHVHRRVPVPVRDGRADPIAASGKERR